MRFPSWSEFNEKLSRFENKIEKSITEFKEDHPQLDKTVNELLPYLPPPFNGIATSLYNSFEGDNIQKIESVLDSLKEIQKQGEEHYERISLSLDTILMEVKDTQDLIKNEEGTKKICMLFTTRIDSIEEELVDISTHFGIKLDVIHKDLLKNQEKLNELLTAVKPEKDIPVGN